MIQSGCGHVNNHFMELLILIHACKISSARCVALLPSLRPTRSPWLTVCVSVRTQWQADHGGDSELPVLASG